MTDKIQPGSPLDCLRALEIAFGDKDHMEEHWFKELYAALANIDCGTNQIHTQKRKRIAAWAEVGVLVKELAEMIRSGYIYSGKQQ